MELQEKVMTYAKENGIKLGFIAEKIGLYQSQLSAWLHGKKDIEMIYKDRLERLVDKQ
ncbi:MAG: hypothetical protein IKW30_03140 [Lachnospiraceae bacterium]|nr:hypothetical protein [Lachnospiraceae bacterium]